MIWKNRVSQTTDKGISEIKMMKSFGQAFSKACAVEGEQPSSPSADGEMSHGVSFLIAFFFAPPFCKEKSG